MQIRNATTLNIHTTTKTAIKQHRNTTTTEVQPTGTKTNTGKIRNINEETETDDQTQTEETIDPESTCYIREMMEDWQNINFIKAVNFTNEKVSDINKTRRGEFRIKPEQTTNKYSDWRTTKAHAAS